MLGVKIFFVVKMESLRCVRTSHPTPSLPPPSLSCPTVRDFLAGVGAGVIEAIFAVTPMESIKTITIEKHLGLVSGVKHIWAEYGLSGFYKGAFATILKQSTNQVS
jgi:hypothetical protein